MIISKDSRESMLTGRSIESLHVVNEIRDYLHKEKQSKILIEEGVVEVAVFGSVAIGKAKEIPHDGKTGPSDIDIEFIFKPFENYELEHESKRFARVQSLINRLKSNIKLHTLLSYKGEGAFTNNAKDKLIIWPA